MTKEEGAAYLARMASCVPGFEEFVAECKGDKGFPIMVSIFRSKLKNEGKLTAEIEMMLKILIEKYEDIRESSFEGIHYINKHLQVDDSLVISEFSNDNHRLTKSGWRFKRAEQQHYKTITEKIAYQEVDYSSIIDKYINYDHPYICSKIAIAYNESKMYHIGLPFLQKALFHVFSYPNRYWHNPWGIIGCTDAIFELQHLLGSKGMIELPILNINGVLECLYLYLSRAIYMSDNCREDIKEGEIPLSAIMKINYLSMRGDIEHDYKYFFVPIFGVGVNPDIQFMSDKSWANHIAQEYGIEMMTQQCYWDSSKMYQHGSLIPFGSIGYNEIEDATWGELIERGRIRAEETANRLYQDYRNGKFQLSIDELESVMTVLKNKLCNTLKNSHI